MIAKILVRSTGETGKGLDALRQKGALPWPNPQDTDAFAAVFDVPMPGAPDVPAQTGLSLFCQEPAAATPEVTAELPPKLAPPSEPQVRQADVASVALPNLSPADALFVAVRDVLLLQLKTPMKDADVAAVLQVSTPQAKVWLRRLVDEGVLEKQKKPAGYIVRQSNLFD